MAPLKFEDNIKESLAKRTITPSEGSWDKLAAKLDGETGKKRTPIWWAIAAGFIGLVIIGSFLFKGDGSDKQQELVIEVNSQEIVDPKEEIAVPKSEIAIETPIEETPTATDKILVKPIPVEKKEQLAVIKPDQTPKSVQENASVISNGTVTKSEVAVIDPKTNKNAFENKVDQVVNQILELQAKNSGVSEAEVAALLDAAQEDLKNKPLINPLTQKVDAMALLDQVEFDLERTFRDKVFNALGDGYNKIRTAMAERNN